MLVRGSFVSANHRLALLLLSLALCAHVVGRRWPSAHDEPNNSPRRGVPNGGRGVGGRPNHVGALAAAAQAEEEAREIEELRREMRLDDRRWHHADTTTAPGPGARVGGAGTPPPTPRLASPVRGLAPGPDHALLTGHPTVTTTARTTAGAAPEELPMYRLLTRPTHSPFWTRLPPGAHTAAAVDFAPSSPGHDSRHAGSPPPPPGSAHVREVSAMYLDAGGHADGANLGHPPPR